MFLATLTLVYLDMDVCGPLTHVVYVHILEFLHGEVAHLHTREPPHHVAVSRVLGTLQPAHSSIAQHLHLAGEHSFNSLLKPV